MFVHIIHNIGFEKLRLLEMVTCFSMKLGLGNLKILDHIRP